MIVVGKISVKAILENRKRKIDCVYILSDRNDKEARYILSKTKGLNVKRVSREELDKICGVDTHGGYAIDCSERQSDSVDTLSQRNAILCVEGVTDPYNLGEIIRTITVLGFDGIITPAYSFYEHEAKLIRASAGASEKITWYQTDNLEETLQKLQNAEIKVIAAHRQETSHSLVEYKFPKRSCICLGGAYRGLSQKVIALADDFVRLEYQERIALSTVGACSVFAYAHFSQHGGNS